MMKKKIFIQDSIFWQFASLLLFIGFAFSTFCFFGSIVAGIKVLITGENSIPVSSWILFELVWTIGMIMCCYEFLSMESFNIHLDDNQIWMNDEKRLLAFKTQYKAVAKLSEIKEITFIKSNLNSKG